MYEKDEYFYRKIFRDICLGYTKSTFKDQVLYVKHLHANDYIEISEKEESFLQKAKDRGIPTEEKALSDAIENELWTEKDEDFISSQEIFVENLVKTKSNLNLKSERDAHQKIIDEESLKLNKKLAEKSQILGNTAEAYSTKQVNDFFIVNSFYKNQDLKEKFLTNDLFDELSYSEIKELTEINNSVAKSLSTDNIQKMILEEFFFPFMYVAEGPMEFYGKPASVLTNNQLTVLTYSRIFKNIFDNNQDIPEKIRKNPEALLDFSSNSKNREKMKSHLDKDGASTVFGATAEDYEYMGVQPTSGKSAISLTEAAKKKGGSLNMQDLMNMT